MAYLSKVTLPSGSTYNLKDALARDYVTKILDKIATKFNAGSDYSAGTQLYRVTEVEATQTVTIDLARATQAIQDAASWESLITLGVLVPTTEGGEIKRLEAKIDSIQGLEFVIAKTAATTPLGVDNYYTGSKITGTLAASATTAGKIYLVKLKDIESLTDIYAEYVTIKDTVYSWECMGTTKSSFEYDTVDVIADVEIVPDTDNVLGEATTFTAPESTVTFTGATDDKVLGEATTFTAKDGDVSLTTDTIKYADIFDTATTTKFVPRTVYTVSDEVLTIAESTTEKIFLPKTSLSKEFATDVDEVTQPTIEVGTNDKVTAITNIGTGKVAEQNITVGTNDKVTVLTSATTLDTDTTPVMKEKA